MARTARAKRAAKAAKAKGATPAQKRAAHAVIKAEKEAQDLAKSGGLEDLRRERTKAMEARAERFKTGGTQSLADTISAANQARAFADAMRRITEREKGVGTPYTGGGVTIRDDGSVSRAKQKAFEQPRFMLGPTDAQKTNIDWMLREGAGDTVRDKRATWREDVWGDKWNEKTGMWEKGDRTAALETQKGLLAGEVPNIYRTDYSQYFPGASGDAANGGLGGILSETPYRRAAPLDWSAIMPTDTPLASQQALVAGKGKFYQPWATRQATPRALINYQMPGGAGVEVGYSNPNLGLFDFNGGTTTNGNGTTTKPGEPAGWVGPIDPKTGKAFPSFMAYTQAMHARNQGLLPVDTEKATTTPAVDTTPAWMYTPVSGEGGRK